jgi:hypothetical protein
MPIFLSLVDCLFLPNTHDCEVRRGTGEPPPTAFESHKLPLKIEIKGMNHCHVRTDVYIRASQLQSLDVTSNQKHMRGVSFQPQHQILSICHSPPSRFQVARPTIVVSAPQCLTCTSNLRIFFFPLMSMLYSDVSNPAKFPSSKFDFGHEMNGSLRRTRYLQI